MSARLGKSNPTAFYSLKIPFICHPFYLKMSCRPHELPKTGQGHKCLFLGTMRLRVHKTTSSCTSGRERIKLLPTQLKAQTLQPQGRKKKERNGRIEARSKREKKITSRYEKEDREGRYAVG